MIGRRARFPSITPQEAHAALRWLHGLGKVKAADIVGALKKREALAREIRATLEKLGGEGLRFLTGAAALRRRQAGKQIRQRVSAKARAAWALQGRYIGAVRQLSKAQRAKVKKIHTAKGVRAAIAAAKKIARG